jgi:hypothetical protein
MHTVGRFATQPGRRSGIAPLPGRSGGLVVRIADNAVNSLLVRVHGDNR